MSPDRPIAPPGYEDLPNPRGFTPVPTPNFPLVPDPAESPRPPDAAAWPSDARFEIDIPLPDGVTLHGEAYLPPGPPAPLVLLLHMWGMDSGSWDRRAPGFLDLLGASGYGWCAYDFRWHGRSGGEPHCAVFDDWKAVAAMPAGDERIARMAALTRQGPPLGANLRFLPDLGHVINYFSASHRIDASRIALLGGSVGANCAWVASSLYPTRLHVCISPWYPSPGWSLMGREVPEFQPRDCLFIADPDELAEACLMAARTVGERTVLEVQGVKEHGIGLLRRPDVASAVLEHLAESLQPA